MDLLKALNLGKAPATATKAVQWGSPAKTVGGTVSTVLDLDDWDLEQGRRLRDGNASSLTDSVTAEAWADFHGCAFLQDPTPRPCSDPRRQAFVETLLGSPEHKALHQSTQLDATASELAAKGFADSWAKLLREDERKKVLRKGKRGDPSKEAMEDDMALVRAAGEAIKDARVDVEDLEDMESALGLGGDGGRDGTTDAGKIAEIFQRVRGDETLKKICERMGAFKMSAIANQKRKTTHGFDDMVGIVTSDDLGKILDHEIADILDEDEDVSLAACVRLVDGEMMAREHHGVEKLAKGDVIVVVDESGSMTGEPVWHAKAFALTMAWIADHQNRRCVLVGYSGGTKGTYLVLEPKRWDHVRLCDWLKHFFGGGTILDVPLVELPGKWEELGCRAGKTDLVLITDGLCCIPEQMEKDFNAWKTKAQCKCVTLVLNSYGKAGEMDKVSDDVFHVRGVDVNEAGVQSCLSI